MQIIAKANNTVLAILKNITKKSSSNRLSWYCVKTETEDGTLLFNLLTREMLLLSGEEYNKIYDIDYLKEHYFVVPEGANEKECADLVKLIFANQKRKTNEITSYTIFTTTDCNARCFYCFELGRSRIPMSHETAIKVVDYISKHCGGKPVNLTWFGGEPLMNVDVIDTICNGLAQKGITFKSRMVTNGYLVDAEIAQKAAEQWNIKDVQITLDGTEKVYNKIKAYIPKSESAYQRVLSNIEKLLDASISVQIRLNMDLYNAEDLLLLVDELSSRFSGRKGLFVYAHHLFKNGVSMADMHSADEWEKRGIAMCQLEERIRESGLMQRSGISNSIRTNHCMADSGKAVTILPNGEIGLCEHYSETEFIGHINKEGFDTALMENWKERMPAFPECAECFYYPMCIKLSKCPSEGACYQLHRQEKQRKISRAMIDQYENWKNKLETEHEEDTDEC